MKWRLANFGLPLLSKELAEMAQRRRTYFVRVAFAVLVLSLSVLIFLPTYNAFRSTPAGFLGRGAQFLDVLYAIEWAGLALFVPALVSGALAEEKERNTLQLLFLTRLGPWTIVFEKLASRLVPVATFLLVSLPLVFVAYLWGGLTQNDLELAIAELALTAFQLASIALFCSALCATTPGALILTYGIAALVFLFPFLAVLGILCFNWCALQLGADQSGLFRLLNAPQNHAAIEGLLTSTIGINLDWVFGRGLGSSGRRPFHTAVPPFVVIPLIGVLFLILAHRVVVQQNVSQPKHRLRRLFAQIENRFTRFRDRYAKGILLAYPDSGLPDANPVLWRENRRGNLGRVNDLIRVLVLVESSLLIVAVISAPLFRDPTYRILGTVGLCLWVIALVVVFVRGTGLFAAEKARQTFDVLLTTPLSLSELAGAKLLGLRRMMAIIALPIVLHALLIAYFRLAIGRTLLTAYLFLAHGPSYFGRGWNDRLILEPGGEVLRLLVVTGLNIVILFNLAAQLAFLFGLYAKTQGRAVTAALGVFAGFCLVPLMLRLAAANDWARDVMYLSPIADILVNEVPRFGVEWKPSRGMSFSVAWQFHPLLHCAFFSVIVVTLAAINRRLAARVLLRPTRIPPRSLPKCRMPEVVKT